MCALQHVISDKMFDERQEDLDRILEAAKSDVEAMMDSLPLIEDDCSQERTGVIKAPTLNACSTGAGNP